MTAPLIYNLFPRLLGPMSRWSAHAGRAREMGFNWIFINPVQYPGFSGSLYAVKDYYRLNPLFISEGSENPMEELRQTIDALHHQGLQVMMDLVVNHTAKDSELVKEHPQWYRRDETGAVVSPSAIDPADARNVTVWGDLAEIDNAHSPDRAALWAYWTAMVQYYLDLGVDGFRCDAAYKVPRRLWDQLIGAARKINPRVMFAAETLGCRLAEVEQLQGAGFDYLFNSSKWWNFDAPWCLEQHRDFQAIAPSIAFAESHDTPRLMSETGGAVQVQKQRYLFSAVFSAGVMMPLGFEFCFQKQVNVVRTMPEDWEETGLDISLFVKEVNRLKTEIPVLSLEGQWTLLTTMDAPTTVLEKADSRANAVLVLVNKDWHAPQAVTVPAWEKGAGKAWNVVRPFVSKEPAPVSPGQSLTLQPAEIAIVES